MTRWLWPFCSWAGCAAAALATAGCIGGDGLPRQPVAGLVTLDGRRLANGVITFFPAKRLIEGTYSLAGSMIQNGRFSIRRAEGLIPGRYRIAVHSGDSTDDRRVRERERDPGNAVSVSKELIPTRYNSDTMLEIEITNNAIKEMNIALTSQ